MPFSEYDTKEGMRAATDWLVPSELTVAHDDGWSNPMIWMT